MKKFPQVPSDDILWNRESQFPAYSLLWCRGQWQSWSSIGWLHSIADWILRNTNVGFPWNWCECQGIFSLMVKTSYLSQIGHDHPLGVIPACYAFIPRFIFNCFLLVGFSPLGGWVFTGQLVGNHQRTQLRHLGKSFFSRRYMNVCILNVHTHIQSK